MLRTMTSILLLSLLTITSSCTAQESVRVTVGKLSDSTVWEFNGRPMMEEHLNKMLSKIASFDTNTVVYLDASTNVSASALVQTIGMIQQSGLSRIILVSPASGSNTNGTWVIGVQCTQDGLSQNCRPPKHGLLSTEEFQYLSYKAGSPSQAYPSENRLSEQETEVLSNYFQTPAKVRQAAEICLQHRLTRGQVLDLLSDVMMIEMGRGRIAFFYAPSQIMTMHYDTNGVIIRVKDAAFDITRDDAVKDCANK